MKTIQIKLFKFNELSEESQQQALENLSDINVYDEWYESVYEDAKNVGLKILGFDIDRGSYVKAKFLDSPEETAGQIIKDHGDMCETYKTAREFLKDRDSLVEKYSDGINKNTVAEDNEYDFDNDIEELEDKFLKSLCEDYRIMLDKEYDWRTSKEAIIESIESNDYDFTEDGKIY